MSLETDLKQIDVEIKKLKIQFDLYFSGVSPKPPSDQREALEKSIKKYQNTTMKSLAEQFLYNSVVNKFNAFQELWSKGLRAKEEGTRVHPLAARAAHLSAKAETGGSAGPSQAVARLAEAARSPDGDSPARATPGRGLVAAVRLAADRDDPEGLQAFYREFVAAKRQAGETKLPAFDAFAREITRHAAAIKGRFHCDLIDYEIYCADNKVKLKARPAK